MTFCRGSRCPRSAARVRSVRRPPARCSNSKLESFDNDASKITYVSPRIGGLQVGFSYVPDSSQQLQTGGALLRNLPHAAPLVGGWTNGYAVATNYTFAIDAFKVGLAAGYEHAQGSGNPNAGTSPDNPWQAGGGARVDYGPLRAIVGYKRVSGVIAGSIGGVAGNAAGTTFDSQPGPNATHSQNGHMWMAGGMYTFGPNAVSLDWQRGQEDGIIGSPRPEKLTIVSAGYGRHLAPGIRAAANLFYMDYTGQPGATAATEIPGNRGWGVATSFRLDF